MNSYRTENLQALIVRQLMSYLATPVAPSIRAYTRRVQIVRERVRRLLVLRHTGQKASGAGLFTEAARLACVQLAAAVTEAERQDVLAQILGGDLAGTEVPSAQRSAPSELQSTEEEERL